MTGTVTLYSQTHFNGVDIPAGPEVLQYAPVVSILNDVYFERMDVDLNHIDLKIQYSSVRDVDYIKLHNNQDNIDFYYRAIPTALAKGTTRMLLKLDALMTLGGAMHVNYISGWQERGHIKKSDDVLFGNLAAENWVPSQQLVCANVSDIKSILTGKILVDGSSESPHDLDTDLSVVVSNVNIADLGKQPSLTIDVIEGIATGSVDPNMYLPAITTIPDGYETEFKIFDMTSAPYTEHAFSLPNTGAFYSAGCTYYNALSNNTRKGLEKLYSVGQLQLQASYQIPKEYITICNLEDDTDKAGLIQNIRGIDYVSGLSSMPYEYTIPNYTIKNKKCFATYRTYTIASLATGDMITKQPQDIYQPNTTYPSAKLWSDPCSTGKPYCRFSYIKNSPVIWQDVVHGMQWQSSQIVIEGASGSVWNSINTAFSNQRLQQAINLNWYQNSIAEANYQLRTADIYNSGLTNVKKGVAETYFSALPSESSSVSNGGLSGTETTNYSFPTKLTGGILNTRLSSATAQNALQALQLEEQSSLANAQFRNGELVQEINQNEIGLLKNNNVIAPSVAFTPEQNLGLYGYNYFVGYEVRKTDEDLKSEDMYYQRYGYNGLHRPLTQQCFKEREYYNFVQAFDVNLKPVNGISLGARVEAAAIAQLNGGVRVWRILPDPAAYETN